MDDNSFQKLNISISFLLDGAKKEFHMDIDKQNENPFYSDTLIKMIIMGSQELEKLMKEYIIKNKIKFEGKLWRKEGGKLLNDIEKKGEFSPSQIQKLRDIIEYRNWVVHRIFQEEFNYNENNHVGSGLVNVQVWNEYYRSKLALTKGLIYEAIDLFSGASSILN